MSNDIGIIFHGNTTGLTSGLDKATAAVSKFGAESEKSFDRAKAKSLEMQSALMALDGKMNASFSKGEMSVKAYSAALRNVPAQFTDIITSLQGGQAPLTVLMQQGGQLKDMFGGMGSAAKALGGYVLGMVNPLTLTAAAVGTSALAYYQATSEIDAYRKALVLSGQAAGVTIDFLQGSAQAVSLRFGSTVGAAADALAQMAGSGDIAAVNIEKFTGSALRFEKYAGVAIKDTIKAFSMLADDPVAASEKLNKETNYLTASVYEQIKALSDQGDKLGAVSLAQTELSVAQDRMATEIQFGLGRVEQAWNLAGGAAKNAWDQFTGVFRPNPIEKTIGDLEKQLNALQHSPSILNGNWQQKTQEELTYWKNIKSSQDDYAANQRKILLQTGAQINLDKAWEIGLDKASKMQREIEAAVGNLVNVDLNVPGNVDKYVKVILGIQGKYKEKPKAVHLTEAQKQVIAGEQAYGNIMAKEDGFAANFTETMLGLTAARDKNNWSAEKYNEVVNAYLAQQPGVLAANKIDAEALKEVTKEQDRATDAYYKSLDAKIAGQEKLAALHRDYSRELAGAGMGTLARSSASGRDQIRDKFADTPDQIKPALDAYEKYLADNKAIRVDWELGAKEGLANYLSDTQNVYASMSNTVGNAFRDMEDALTNFTKTGTLDFGSMADSIISDLIRIQVQQSITRPLGEAINGAGGIGGLFSSIFNANGNVYTSPSLSAYSGGVYNTPQTFAFASGAGVFAEAGPEAIMPLKRGSNGKLGVQATGGVAQPAQVINISINATVGDIASKADVVAGMRATANHITAQIQRNRTYGGAMA